MSSSTVPSQPQPAGQLPTQGYSAQVKKEGTSYKLYLGEKEVVVKYGDEVRLDPHELAKMASLLNKHYDTKQLYDELFSKPAGKLALSGEGITNLTNKNVIKAVEKKYKGEEAPVVHYARKLNQIEESIKQSHDLGLAVADIGKKYTDGAFKNALGNLLSDSGVDLDTALTTGEFKWKKNHSAPLLHLKENVGILNALQAALKRAPLVTDEQNLSKSSPECRKELIAILKNYGLDFAEGLQKDTLQSRVGEGKKIDPATFNTAKSAVSEFLKKLDLPDVDANLDLTVPVSHLKLGNKATPTSTKTRLEELKEEVAKLSSQPKRDTLQLYVYNRMIKLWDLYQPQKQAPAAVHPSGGQTEPEAESPSEPGAGLEFTALKPSAKPGADRLSLYLAEEEEEAPVTETAPGSAAVSPRGSVSGMPLVLEPAEGEEAKQTRREPALTGRRPAFDVLIARLETIQSEREKMTLLSQLVNGELEVDELKLLKAKYFSLLNPQLQGRLQNQLNVKEAFAALETSRSADEKKTIVTRLITYDLFPDEIQDLMQKYPSPTILTPEQNKTLIENYGKATRKSHLRTPLDRIGIGGMRRAAPTNVKSDLFKQRAKLVSQEEDAGLKEPTVAEVLAEAKDLEENVDDTFGKKPPATGVVKQVTKKIGGAISSILGTKKPPEKGETG